MIVLLAPGPSMSQALADSVRGCRVGAVTSALPLAPWAEFVAASDVSWWRRMGAMAYPVASRRMGVPSSRSREKWAYDLAWKQWSLDEIRSGEALAGIVEILRGR